MMTDGIDNGTLTPIDVAPIVVRVPVSVPVAVARNHLCPTNVRKLNDSQLLVLPVRRRRQQSLLKPKLHVYVHRMQRWRQAIGHFPPRPTPVHLAPIQLIHSARHLPNQHLPRLLLLVHEAEVHPISTLIHPLLPLHPCLSPQALVRPMHAEQR